MHEKRAIFWPIQTGEFAAGDWQQASEKLYGAANEALSAVALQRGWRYRTHRDMKNASQRLAEEFSDLFLIGGFSIAEKFHKNFYHDEMGRLRD